MVPYPEEPLEPYLGVPYLVGPLVTIAVASSEVTFKVASSFAFKATSSVVTKVHRIISTKVIASYDSFQQRMNSSYHLNTFMAIASWWFVVASLVGHSLKPS